MGNISAGHELISRTAKKDVYGKLLGLLDFTHVQFKVKRWYPPKTKVIVQYYVSRQVYYGYIQHLTYTQFILFLGLTLPLVTTEEGDKFGKSAGNAIWLDPQKTSPFSLYQFFIRTKDSEVEKLLKLFSFYTLGEIKDIMFKHQQHPEQRYPQTCLADQLTTLVHGSKEFLLSLNLFYVNVSDDASITSFIIV